MKFCTIPWLKNKNINVEFDQKITKLIAQKSQAINEGGARKLQKIIQEIVEIPLSQKILENQIKQGDDLIVSSQADTMQVMAKNVIIS